jgi:hypothetical protein
MLAEDVVKASGTNKQNDEEVEQDESERMGAAEAWRGRGVGVDTYRSSW